jgi:hypothetical protein
VPTRTLACAACGGGIAGKARLNQHTLTPPGATPCLLAAMAMEACFQAHGQHAGERLPSSAPGSCAQGVRSALTACGLSPQYAPMVPAGLQALHCTAMLVM